MGEEWWQCGVDENHRSIFTLMPKMMYDESKEVMKVHDGEEIKEEDGDRGG